MSVFHDEIEIEDFEYDEEEETYYYPCPCGDRFQITKVRIERKFFRLTLFFVPLINYLKSFVGRTACRRRNSNLSKLFSYSKSCI